MSQEEGKKKVNSVYERIDSVAILFWLAVGVNLVGITILYFLY